MGNRLRHRTSVTCTPQCSDIVAIVGRIQKDRTVKRLFSMYSKCIRQAFGSTTSFTKKTAVLGDEKSQSSFNKRTYYVMQTDMYFGWT